jgi:hypothetical protein
MARERRPAGAAADRGRLLHDAHAWLLLLDYRRRLGGGKLDGHWQTIDAALTEALTPSDLAALRGIVAGRGARVLRHPSQQRPYREREREDQVRPESSPALPQH